MGSFIGLAAVTGGELTHRRRGARRPADDPHRFQQAWACPWRSDGDDLLRPRPPELEIRKDLGGGIPKIDDAPWPAFPTDLMSHRHRGRHPGRGHRPLLREDVREPDVLRRQPHRHGRAASSCATPTGSWSSGPPSSTARTWSSPDIRAGMALLIAALVRQGPEHDPQHAPDRPRLRARGREAPRAGRLHRAEDRHGAGARIGGGPGVLGAIEPGTFSKLQISN